MHMHYSVKRQCTSPTIHAWVVQIETTKDLKPWNVFDK
jgi:hypothetical protein